MKLNKRHGVLLLALAGLGTVIAGSTLAAPVTGDATSASAPGPAGFHHRGHGFHGGPGGSFFLGTLLHAAHELNLTAEQKTQIRTILTSARSQGRPATGAPDIAVLGNPADPNYATALQGAKASAAARIDRESELQGQVYNVLTPEQKAQLPAVLASIKAKIAQHRAQRAAG